jgi:hypothetical protein
MGGMRAAMVLAFGARLALTADVAAETVRMPDDSGVGKLGRELGGDPARAMKPMRGGGRSSRGAGADEAIRRGECVRPAGAGAP